MIRVRKSGERHHANRGWLDSYFTFSFADYHDPDFMGFRALRVMNEDTIEPAEGFGPHAHRDMEIMTYVLEGALEHRDSTGEERVLGPNEIQTMSAGSGVVHSEYNASSAERVHLMQIWIEPAEEDLVPSYQQVEFDPERKRGRLLLLAGPETDDPAPQTVIRQDARLYVGQLADSRTIPAPIAAGRHAWVQVVRGAVTLNGQALAKGDGAAISGEPGLSITGAGADDAEFLLFDLA